MSEQMNDSVVTCPVSKQRCTNPNCSYDIGADITHCNTLKNDREEQAQKKLEDAFEEEAQENPPLGSREWEDKNLAEEVEIRQDGVQLTEPGLTLEQAQAVVETKTAPRVTKDWIEQRISQVRYILDGTGTFCIIQMCNGFEVNGFSKPADPMNYDQEVGQRYAYENAFRQLWQLEGYLLCEQLSTARRT